MIFEQLGLAVPENFDLNEVKYGGFSDGTKVMKGQPIFPRIEVESEKTPQKEAPKAKKAEKKNVGVVTPEEIAIDDFQKVDLRVAAIKTAERVPNTDKLMKITVDMAGRERIIVSGIAQYYDAKELIGKNVIVVANLKPAKLKGIESRACSLLQVTVREISFLPKCRGLRRAARSNNGTTSLF